MSWINNFEEQADMNDKYIKVTGEMDLTVSLTIDPVRRDVQGTDGVTRTYWDLQCKDDKLLSCTNYLFGVIRRELDQLRGQVGLGWAVLRIKKVVGDKVSWVVVLKGVEPA